MNRHPLIALWLSLGACGQPEPTPEPPRNQPLRVVGGTQVPQRFPATLRVGTNCPPSEASFSVRVSDPDVQDVIRAQWFIDPNDRYVAELGQPVVSGNPGVLLTGTSERLVTSPAALRSALAAFADGQRHRVEVVVSDGDFIEATLTDPGTGEVVPFLDVTRAPVRTESGLTVPIEAFRDDTVWFVEVSTTPCL